MFGGVVGAVYEPVLAAAGGTAVSEVRGF
eukprot:COSAG01_NODE_57659_length_310_cov_101.601896_1_plen_28_part_01